MAVFLSVSWGWLIKIESGDDRGRDGEELNAGVAGFRHDLLPGAGNLEKGK